MKKIFLLLSICVFATGMLTGCGSTSSSVKSSRSASSYEKEIAQLRKNIRDLEADKRSDMERLEQDKNTEIVELMMAKEDLEKSLRSEIGSEQATLSMTDRGLVISFLAEIFFDPGRDVIGPEGKEVLKKVAKILNKDVRDSRIAVDGHTDDDPIKYSGWKSNWELSSARALAVLHFLIEEGGVNPDRLSADAYGEYTPLASNRTVEGKQKNRRVEIVVLPAQIKKVR